VTATIDLVTLGVHGVGDWGLGVAVAAAVPTPAGLAAVLDAHLDAHRPDALLLWDARLGPPPAWCEELLDSPDDVWHAGLALGTTGLPASIDLVAPTWMLNADPVADRPASSWRLSPSACLVRTGVIEALGHLDPSFDTLSAAGLEAGHRWITRGALCRHEPRLVAGSGGRPPLHPVPPADKQRFVHRRFGRRWALYATLRAPHRVAGLRRLRALGTEAVVAAGEYRTSEAVRPTSSPPSVTVVIPTVDRYPWLQTVLDDLGGQTVTPSEVLVVDQTPPDRRQPVAGGGSVRVIPSEQVGQCSARNLALVEARGDRILFLDDDDELDDDLVARHHARLDASGADASCGVAREPGESALEPSFRRLRQSDVFPTNNTMLRREALELSGLFDLAYDRGERADHDLGMRLYLAGARLVLDPEVAVLHHHAPSGGLRTHAARVRTYRASRHSTVARHHLAPTELYLWQRYYRPDQVEEAVRLRMLGTFSRRGALPLRLLRVLVQLVLLPDTLRRLRRARRAASELARDHPTIPALHATPSP
jgi:GT2 family glycosyltransferase